MTTKQMILAAMIFVSADSFTQYNSKDFAFNHGKFTEINGNDISGYLCVGRFQLNPSYVFEYIRVIECTKDKKMMEVGTLGSLEKKYSSYLGVIFKSTVAHRFEEFVSMNNAIYCADIEQKMNYYDELENIGAIVYGTRDVKDCALLREYLKQQELAAKK